MRLLHRYTIAAVIVMIILGISACDENDGPRPSTEEETFDTTSYISGKADRFSIATSWGVESVHGASFIMTNEKMGKRYSVAFGKADKGYGDNAILTLSEVEVMLPESKLYWWIGRDSLHPQTPAMVDIKPTKIVYGKMEFNPNWKDDVLVKMPYNLFEVRRIEFTVDSFSIWESGKSSKEKLRYLYQHKSECEKTLSFLLRQIHDIEPFEEGEQRMPISVVISKAPE